MYSQNRQKVNRVKTLYLEKSNMNRRNEGFLRSKISLNGNYFPFNEPGLQPKECFCAEVGK